MTDLITDDAEWTPELLERLDAIEREVAGVRAAVCRNEKLLERAARLLQSIA